MQEIARAFQEGGIFMYVILLVSVVGIGLMIERFIFLFFKYNINANQFMAQIQKLVMANNIDRAIKLCEASDYPILQLVKAGLTHANKGPDEIDAALSESGLSPEYLEAEITESVIMDQPERAVEQLSALKEQGISIALDDFGSGLSSFAYLKNLPVDYLKIDGNIIKNISKNTTDKEMVAAINQIGKVMNIKTIAKNVENVFTLNQLKEISIDYAQGFYLDKPGKLSERVDEIKRSTTKHSIRH